MCIICMKDVFTETSVEHMEKAVKELKRQEILEMAGALKMVLERYKDNSKYQEYLAHYKQAQYMLSRYL